MSTMFGVGSLRRDRDRRSVNEFMPATDASYLTAQRPAAAGRDRSVHCLLRAGFWLALLVMHAAGVVYAAMGVASGEVSAFDGGVRIALLLASSVLFALKVVGAPCVRLTAGWRSGLAAIVAVGLTHVGVARRAVHGEAAVKPSSVGIVLALGAAGHAALVRRWVLEARDAWADSVPVSETTATLRRLAESAHQRLVHVTQLTHLLTARALRAPPLV